MQKTLNFCQQSQSYWTRHCGKSMRPPKQSVYCICKYKWIRAYGDSSSQDPAEPEKGTKPVGLDARQLSCWEKRDHTPIFTYSQWTEPQFFWFCVLFLLLNPRAKRRESRWCKSFNFRTLLWKEQNMRTKCRCFCLNRHTSVGEVSCERGLFNHGQCGQ